MASCGKTAETNMPVAEAFFTLAETMET